MLAIKPFAISLVLSVISLTVGSVIAQENVRYYEKDGLTYRESREVVQRPLVQTELQPRERVTYREQYSTTIEPQARTVYTPVTTYQWQARWRDVLNPFRPATMAYQLVPQTQWQAHVEHVDTPVSRREVIPQREIVDVPVTTQRFVDEEVIRRTVVNSQPGNGTAVARREVVGGVSRLENDPPRSRVENDPPRDGANWRPASDP